jgi:hypothetical protein
MLREAEAALNAELYYAALAVCLTIPDVGAALESKTGRTNGPRYQAWFEQNATSHIGAGYLTKHECWLFRCAFLHQGKTAQRGSAFGKILFLGPPDASHNIVMKQGDVRILCLGIEPFCQGMISAAREWFAFNEHKPLVRKNMRGLVQYYPNGVPRYMTGRPAVG